MTNTTPTNTISMDQTRSTASKTGRAGRPPRVRRKAAKTSTTGKTTKTAARATAAASGASTAPTKLDKVIALLARPKGASIDELCAATGWQAHSVRGAISGSLKKKMGLLVSSTTIEGRGRVYRIDEPGKRAA